VALLFFRVSLLFTPQSSLRVPVVNMTRPPRVCSNNSFFPPPFTEMDFLSAFPQGKIQSRRTHAFPFRTSELGRPVFIGGSNAPSPIPSSYLLTRIPRPADKRLASPSCFSPCLTYYFFRTSRRDSHSAPALMCRPAVPPLVTPSMPGTVCPMPHYSARTVFGFPLAAARPLWYARSFPPHAFPTSRAEKPFDLPHVVFFLIVEFSANLWMSAPPPSRLFFS